MAGHSCTWAGAPTVSHGTSPTRRSSGRTRTAPRISPPTPTTHGWRRSTTSTTSCGAPSSPDFRTFGRMENVSLPFNRNGVLFPRTVNGKYLLLSRPSDSGHTPFGDVYLSESPDLVHWGRHRRVMKTSEFAWWQAIKVGAGAVPIETTEGWLLFYH